MNNLNLTRRLALPGVALTVLAATMLLTGCTGAQKGAGYGGAAGAGLGAIIGHQSGETGAGAIIGAGAGALLGALIGDAVEDNQRKQQARSEAYRSTAYTSSERVEYREVQVGFRTEEVVEPIYVPPKYKYIDFVGYDEAGNEYRETKRVLVEEGHYENRTVTREVPIYERIPVKVRD